VPLAEQTGIIRLLTRWVLRSAIRQCRAFMDSGMHLTVSVNLSARNLREADLAEYVFALLKECGVPPELLVLELTETAIMQSPELALRVLGTLREGGVRSSIDDFGTGYTSLAHLRRLPVSELKIDRAFVQSMTAERGDALLTQAIVAMGHSLGLEVVAEGVEDEATLNTLRQLGCDRAQGYHISRPQSADSLIAWLRKQRGG
jgi:EAL domain-containing protein (putative c-di-GMP-specific phosphodiesterase class I)